MRTTWIGHATALIQIAGVNVLTDPVFAETVSPLPGIGPKRAHPPGIAYADLPHIDVVLISHAHYDHLEAATIRALARDHAPCFVAGLGLQAWLQDHGATWVTTLDWWQSGHVGALTVTATPAKHWSRRGVFDRNRVLWCGYVIACGGQHVYFAGDTGYDGALFAAIATRFPDLGCALLPIGAYEPRVFMAAQHMNPAEAAQAFEALAPASAIAIHFGTFRLTDESREAPARDLAAALSTTQATRFIVPVFGAPIDLDRRAPINAGALRRAAHSWPPGPRTGYRTPRRPRLACRSRRTRWRDGRRLPAGRQCARPDGHS